MSRILRQQAQEFLLHTGQHYDSQMSQVFFDELDIPKPDLNLEVGSGSHGSQTAAMLVGIEETILRERPDVVMVYGDTNSTLAAALAASKLSIALAHVEAGLRSFDRRMPEEINRVVADHLSDLLLCPTESAASQLSKEGITRGVVVTGDVMHDAFLQNLERARTSSTVLQDNGLQSGQFVLATIHRAENTDDRQKLEGILGGLAAAGTSVVLPLHPRTRKTIASFGLAVPSGVLVIDPVGYLDMLTLEGACRAVVTDSGGVQKEAYFAGKPCITLRDTTEWTETVTAGWNRLVGSDTDSIASAIREATPAATRIDVYGDGHASEKVVAAVLSLSRD